jgi:hypothetical protein
MPSPVDKIKALQKKSIERNGVFLPKWDAANRAAPNEIVRSALFNARNKTKKREYFKQTEIALIGNGSIKYTGEELRQDDETVWLQVLHLAREHPLEDLIEFSAYSILKSLDWPTTVFYYKKLEECLNRMAATNVIIESKRLGKSCAVSIIRKYEKSDDGKMWRVWIEKEMKSLFDGNCYTISEWEQRLALPVGIATWLHAYLASHKNPYDIKIETIMLGAGLTMSEKKHATEQIKKALKGLEDVGFLKSWKIEIGKICVQRTSDQN